MLDIFVRKIKYLRYSLLLTDFLLFVYALVTRFDGAFVYSVVLLLVNVLIQLYSLYTFKQYHQIYVVQKVQKIIALVVVVGFCLLMFFAQSMLLNTTINIVALILSSCLVVLYPAPDTYGQESGKLDGKG